MLAEEFVTAVLGPQLSSNTAIAKDVGLYLQTLNPTYAVKATFKKSAASVNCVAVSDTHIFAAQNEKAYVHVYSRLRGNQEAFIPLSDRIRCLVLVNDVLALGTTEGKVLLWEICTGRLVSTPPCHVQAISCMAATSSHLITGSDDSNINVWSLSTLLELEATVEPEPVHTLSNHRAAITSLVASPGSNSNTNLCVSASKDKSCIVWNYQTGHALRTIVFPSFPLCICLDSCARTLFASSSEGGIYLIEFFGENPVLGRLGPQPTTVIQAPEPMAQTGADCGPASCLALSYDSNTLLSGHPNGQIFRWHLNGHGTELANLNSPVTNLTFISPIAPPRHTRPLMVVKPSQAGREFTFTAQFEESLESDPATRFSHLLRSPGASPEVLENATRALEKPIYAGEADDKLRNENEELRKTISELRALQKKTLEMMSGGEAQ